MKITVRYFAALREALGSNESVELPAGASVGTLRDALLQRGGRHAELLARQRAVRCAVEALYDAADDDSATGGPDVGRRIWPSVGIVDDSGARFLTDEEIAPVVDAIIASRVGNPGGAR